MRKKALLKKYGSRKNMYKILRESNLLKEVADNHGNPVVINPVKHFLKQSPYRNTAFNRELISIAQKYTEYLKSVTVQQDADKGENKE